MDRLAGRTPEEVAQEGSQPDGGRHSFSSSRKVDLAGISFRTSVTEQIIVRPRVVQADEVNPGTSDRARRLVPWINELGERVQS